MTHDAMWVLHAHQTVGIEKVNDINHAAIDSLSTYDGRRLKKALGADKVEFDTFEKVAEFMKLSFDIVRTEFMTFKWAAPEHGNGRGWLHQVIKAIYC